MRVLINTHHCHHISTSVPAVHSHQFQATMFDWATTLTLATLKTSSSCRRRQLLQRSCNHLACINIINSNKQQSTSGFGFSDGTRSVRWKSTCLPNFDETSQSVAKIKLLPVSWNWRPPYWNCTSGFDLDLRVVILQVSAKFHSNRTISGGVVDLSFRSYCHFYILAFWLEIAYTRPFWGFWRHIPPNDVTHRHHPQKAPSYSETRRLSHKAWKSVQRFDLGTLQRKKIRRVQKSHKVVIFRLFRPQPADNH